MFGMNFTANPTIGKSWFFWFIVVEACMGFILVTWGGPGMITKDFANYSVQLYLSRPLSRTEYLVGKVSVLGALLSCTTWIPALVLLFVEGQLRGNGWIWENLWIAGAIIVACLIGIAVVSLLSMALAVWVKWRIAVTALMMGVFFLLPILGLVMSAILRTSWGNLMDLPFLTAIIWAHLFRLDAVARHQFGLDAVPLWSAWAMLLSVCAFCFWLLDRKLQAREVERA